MDSLETLPLVAMSDYMPESMFYLRETVSHLQISSKTRTMYLWTKRGDVSKIKEE